ncbi:hypothetical protein [Paenibacillus sp. FSL W8-0194]|uniref:hypothetical protein n=1 Tax=Paenibacillus sp. FSL W8-0194 TaxID=2921711 RepID=UPI0030D8E178
MSRISIYRVQLKKFGSVDMRNLNYDRFRNDPEWLEIRRISELEGPLVEKLESLFMKNATFFTTK